MNNIKALLKFIGDLTKKLIGMKVGLDVEADKQKELAETISALRKCIDSGAPIIRCDHCGSYHFHEVSNPY